MRSFATALFVVFVREVRERRLLFFAALLLGVLAIVASFMPFPGHEPELVREAVAGIGSTLLGAGVLIFVGSSILCREWTRDRLGFHLSRPIGAAPLWFGKLAAAFVLTLASVVLVWMPSVLVGGEPWSHFSAEIPWMSLLSLLLLLVLFASHAIGVVVHLRGLASLVDIVLAAITGLALYRFFTRFARYTYYNPAEIPAAILLAAFFFAGLVAPWAQIRFAGTDARRAHRVFSAIVWLSLATATLGLYASTWSFERPNLDRAREIRGTWPLPGGRTVVLAEMGPWGHFPFLVLDPDRDRPIPLGTLPRQHQVPIASPDGDRLVWTSGDPREGSNEPRDLYLLDLDAERPAPRRLGSYVLPWAEWLDFREPPLAASANRIALYVPSPPRIVFLRTDSASLGPSGYAGEIREIPLPFDWTGRLRLRFLDDERLRVWLWQASEPVPESEISGPDDARFRLVEAVVALDLDPRSLEWVERYRLEGRRLLSISPDGERIGVGPKSERPDQWPTSELEVHDAETGEFLFLGSRLDPTTGEVSPMPGS